MSPPSSAELESRQWRCRDSQARLKIFVEAVRAKALRHKCFGPFVDLVVLGDEVGGGSVARRRLREEESRPKKGSHLADWDV